MADWRIAQELAARFGAEFGLETVEDVQDEIARVAPAHVGVDAELIRRARDGAVLPVADFPDEIVLHAPEGSAADAPFELGYQRLLGAHPRRGTVAAGRAGRVGGTGGAERTGGRSSSEPRRSSCPRCTSGTASHRAPAATPPDAYSLRLVAARTLYDAGRIVSSSPSLAALATGVALVVHPSDLERIGVSAEGDDVLVTSARGTVRLPVLADAATAPGTAFMAFAQKGDVGPNDLVDITAPLTELRVETTR